ncbi:hypothetical protein, partial [Leptospira langatensis]|uniref:hypothetical protein n=1 Tax=Leptospira langatensis TaxID=2484983 RepID=UPI001AEFAAF6
PGTTAYTATAEPTLKSSATFNSGTGPSGTATAYYEGYLKPNDYLRVIVRDSAIGNPANQIFSWGYLEL